MPRLDSPYGKARIRDETSSILTKKDFNAALYSSHFFSRNLSGRTLTSDLKANVGV